MNAVIVILLQFFGASISRLLRAVHCYALGVLSLVVLKCLLCMIWLTIVIAAHKQRILFFGLQVLKPRHISRLKILNWDFWLFIKLSSPLAMMCRIPRMALSTINELFPLVLTRIQHLVDMPLRDHLTILLHLELFPDILGCIFSRYTCSIGCIWAHQFVFSSKRSKETRRVVIAT